MDKQFEDFENLIEKHIFNDDDKQLFEAIQSSYTDGNFNPQIFAIAINSKFKKNLLEVLNAYHRWLFDNLDITS